MIIMIYAFCLFSHCEVKCICAPIYLVRTQKCFFSEEALARHPFGNFVVQHIFEHGLPERKSRCFQLLLPHVLQHATHKTASNVVQRMLEHADVTSQALIADAFLAGQHDLSLETIAATRGSY